jgi:hypothetical protein
MTDADRAAVTERSVAWQRALEARDVAGIDDFLDPDYALVLVHPATVTVPRAQWLRMLPDYVVHSWTVSECAPDGAWRVWRRHSTPLSASELLRA